MRIMIHLFVGLSSESFLFFFIAGLMLYAQTDSTIQVITAHEDAIPDTIVMNADTPGNFVKNEASDAALDKQSPDSQQIADLFDSLLVDNPDFYKEEYKLLKNRPEACFDTLIQFFRHEPDKDLAFRALAVASFTGNLSHIKVMHEILQNLPEADQTEFRLIINACRINMRETIKDTYYHHGSVVYAIEAINLNETGFYAMLYSYRSMKKEFREYMKEEAGKFTAESFVNLAIAAVEFAIWRDKTIERYNNDVKLAIPDIESIFHLNNTDTKGKRYYYQKLLFYLLHAISKVNNQGLIPNIQRQFRNSLNEEELNVALYSGWGNIGKDAVPSIIESIQDKKLSKYARKALFSIHDEKVIPVLIQYLTHKDENVVTAIVQYFGENNVTQAIPALMETLSYDHYKVLLATIQVLGDMNATQAIPALEPLKKHRIFKVRDAAKVTIKQLEKQ